MIGEMDRTGERQQPRPSQGWVSPAEKANEGRGYIIAHWEVRPGRGPDAPMWPMSLEDKRLVRECTGCGVKTTVLKLTRIILCPVQFPCCPANLGSTIFGGEMPMKNIGNLLSTPNDNGEVN